MICDSPEQKNFLLDAVRKYPCNYETALNLAQAFGSAIQDAQVVKLEVQNEKFPRAANQGGNVPIKKPANVPSDNGNDKPAPEETAKQAEATDPAEPSHSPPAHDLTKGPAPE